ncbi:hypothetical protein QGA_1771 [Clostridioides difficile CD181]|nr:hypothetical protein QCA_1708 [Clostridioides difficile CD40]EQF54926.1 hypothetical protein QGA_1771 [Clostridioides difficile CD181]EQK61837.1 hypothetical protein C676_0475 [Clostridioides difficile F548]
MTISTIQTLLYNLGTICPKVRQLPPPVGGFFHVRDFTRRNGGIYAVFHFRYHYFADPCCCPRRWPWRVGRGEFAGGLRLGQPRCKKPGYEAAHGWRRHHRPRHYADPPAVRPVLRAA